MTNGGITIQNMIQPGNGQKYLRRISAMLWWMLSRTSCIAERGTSSDLYVHLQQALLQFSIIEHILLIYGNNFIIVEIFLPYLIKPFRRLNYA